MLTPSQQAAIASYDQQKTDAGKEATMQFEPSLEPDSRRQEQFERECEAAESTMAAMLFDHGRKCLKVDHYEPTDDSELGNVKLRLVLDLEVKMNDPSVAIEALRLLAEGLETL